jgi:predicted DNA-binding protein
VSEKSRQQNFRLPDDLIGRLEAVVPAKGRAFVPGEHRAKGKSEAVREALEEWLARDLEHVLVGNAAGEGTVLRVHGALVPAPGSRLRTLAGEVVVVRSVAGPVLYVERGVGTPVFAIQAGSLLALLSGSLEASPRESAPAAGNGAVADPPIEAAPQGGQGEGSSPAPPESVDLAGWLAERLGKPRAVVARYIAAGRVSVEGEPVGECVAEALELVELDGERVS